MKRLIRIGLCALALCACEAIKPTDFLSFPRGERKPTNDHSFTEENPVIPGEELPVLPKDKDLYVSALINSEEGGKKIALYKNGSRILLLDCSLTNRISEDPDTHFLIDSLLFTTYKAGGQTIIKRNGENYLEFGPESFVKDLLLVDGDIWTMDLPVGESGFRIRKNGEVLFSKNEGISSVFYLDANNVCFSYTCQLADQKFIYLVKDNVEIQVSSRYGGPLLAARLLDGKLWTLERVGEQYRLSDGEDFEPYFMPAGFTFLNAEILPLSDGTCMAILHMKSNYSAMCADLICRDGRSILKGSGTAVYYYTEQSPEMAVILSKDAQILYISSIFEKEDCTFDGPRLLSRKCAIQEDGKFYAALSYKDGTKPPFLWRDGETMVYNIEGLFSAISFSPPK
ncbi:MAG: hypothetical protein ACI3ZF_04170 [Candidatus Cryptobacteroides sp.]